MSVMDRITQRYSDSRQQIEVPEWGIDGEPLIIYARPYTIADDAKVARFTREDSPDGFIEVLVNKAEQEDGSPMFTLQDKPKLKRTGDASVVKRIAMRIMAPVSIESAEKN